MTDEGDVIRRVTEEDGPIYPEHEKLKEVAPLSQAIYDFIEWCGPKGVSLMQWSDAHDNWVFPPPIRELLAEHFDIDEDKIEVEKRAMIGYMRAANEKRNDGQG